MCERVDVSPFHGQMDARLRPFFREHSTAWREYVRGWYGGGNTTWTWEGHDGSIENTKHADMIDHERIYDHKQIDRLGPQIASTHRSPSHHVPLRPRGGVRRRPTDYIFRSPNRKKITQKRKGLTAHLAD